MIRARGAKGGDPHRVAVARTAEQVLEFADLVAAVPRTARLVMLDEHRVPCTADPELVPGHARRQRRERQSLELRSQAREPDGQVIVEPSDRTET